MFNNIDDVVKFGAEPIEKVHDQSTIRNRRVDVREHIRYRFQFLTVFMNRHVSDDEIAELIVQLYGSCFFVVTKQVFECKP